jgi:hypothetical protein
MQRGRALLHLFFCVLAVMVTTPLAPTANAALPVSWQGRSTLARTVSARPARQAPGARVVLSDVPDNIIPQNNNKWNCSCDTDGCWPGCFTVASASIVEYWSQKGYANLWNGDANGTLVRLRELFPNLICEGNGDNNGKPGDTSYDAYDVASGLTQFIQEKGYRFTLTPIPAPTFEQIMAEIDAGRPIIGAFAESPWGSHAGTIVGYDTSDGHQVMIVRPNLWQKMDTALEWGTGYKGLGLVTVNPGQGEGGSTANITTTAPIAPQVTFEVVVNDKDPGFAAQGNWQVTQTVAPDNGSGGAYGGEARSVISTDPSNLGPTTDTSWARWNPSLPFDGMWEVLAWAPMTDTEDSATQHAVYQIKHAEGMSYVPRSQHDATPGWMSLGSFPFVRGDQASVYLGNLTGDVPLRNIWADAVKFVWRAPLIVRSEEDDSQLFIVQNGRRDLIPDPNTFNALRLSKSNIRKLTPMALAQYPAGELLPSIFGGWVGQYFNNTMLAPPTSVVRADPRVNFAWNGAAPAANMSSLGFSARWSRIMALSEGHYPFRIDAVGGVRLYVDGRLELNEWDSSSLLIQHQTEVSVTSGLHLVEIEYANREGAARVTLGNLPPNVPIVINNSTNASPQWTAAPTMTVAWLDGGDADGSAEGKPRRFYVAAWRDGNLWNANSGWITATQWAVPLPADGVYHWRVMAGDGNAQSDWSAPQDIHMDRTPPWAQMESAQSQTATLMLTNQPAAPTPVSGVGPQPAPLVEGALITAGTTTKPVPPWYTDTQTVTVVDANASANASPLTLEGTSVGQLPVGSPLGASSSGVLPLRSFGVQLTWWATDTLSGIGSIDVQARERVHMSLRYTPTVEMHEVTRLSYALELSGSEQITHAIVLTALVPYTTVAPIQVFTPITDSAWVTVASGLVNTQTLFLGNPGSIYEFRVRARDQAGNAQDWYDGYSVQAQVDPNLHVTYTYIPLVIR